MNSGLKLENARPHLGNAESPPAQFLKLFDARYLSLKQHKQENCPIADFAPGFSVSPDFEFVAAFIRVQLKFFGTAKKKRAVCLGNGILYCASRQLVFH